jgi:hypothetical protein
LRIPGSSHYPHAEQPGQVSAALDEIFSQADAPPPHQPPPHQSAPDGR